MLQWLNRKIAKSSETTLPHKVLGSVVLRRSGRAKRISITVLSSGDVRLTLPIKGSEKEAMRFLDERVAWIEEARERVAQRPAQRVYSKAEIEELRRRAKVYLPGRLAELSDRFGFRVGRVTVRATRSKWGSCSGDNNISLSLFLMNLPPHLIDFVIIHELCHTVHHDHSPQFHALVDRCVGGRERSLQRELRTMKI